jgi:N-acetylmuramoyl-L-alanine amidase
MMRSPRRRAISMRAAALLAVLALGTPAADAHIVAPGETLSGIAAANGLTTAALAAANGLSADALVIAGSTLQVPAAGTPASTTQAPAAAPSGAAPPAGGHFVIAGETLSGIAAANGLSTEALAAANGLSPTAFVITGTTLHIPAAGSAPAPAAATGSQAQSAGPAGGHLVTTGETLSGIAAANGLTTQALAAANGLTATSFVIAGTRLRIPAAVAGSASGAPQAASGHAPEAMGGYIVRPGDTLAALASRSRLPVAQVAAMNGLKPDAMLLIGQPLKLPTGSPVLATAPATTGPVSAALAPQAAPNPVPGRLSAGEIESIAAAHGVPGSLAAAIAWQESGFNNAMVSAANARGVMQIMPGTWAWVQQNLAPRPLDPNSPLDNVHAGTLYLGQLLRDAGGDPALAAAGYYQGLASVRRIGMLPETKRYVDNVLALRGRFGG